MQIYLETNWNNINGQDWDALLPSCPTHTIFQTYGWNKAAVRHMSRESALYVLLAKDGEKLLGIAPLMIVHKKTLRIVKFICSQHTDYCDFLYDRNQPDILGAMLSYLAKEKDKWDAMALDHIRADSKTVGILPDVFADAGLYASKYSTLLAPAVVFDDGKAALKQILGKKSLQRHYSHFFKLGDYQVHHEQTAGGILKYLEAFFEQHIQRWGKLSLFLDQTNKQFYKDLAVELERDVVFTIVSSRGKPIAFHFGFMYQGKFIWYKPSFDQALSKYSPGEVLLRELVIFAEAQGCKEFDFTLGDEAFKSRFANTAKDIQSFKVFKSRRHRVFDSLIGSAKALLRP